MTKQKHDQFLFVCELNNDVDVFTYIFPTFTFIYLSEIFLILSQTSYLHVNHLIVFKKIVPKTLCLSKCKICDGTIKSYMQILNQYSNISTLLLLNNDLSSSLLKQLIHNINSKAILRNVTVHQKNMSEDDLFLIEDTLKNVQLLLINDKVLRGCNCSHEQLKYASQNSPSIATLVIKCFDIKNHTLNLLNELFKQCVHLQEIVIFDSFIGSQITDELLQLISNITTLRILNLRGNSLTAEAAEPLSFVIFNNTGLEELYLGNNQLQLGATKLTTALKNISSLKVLDLENNDIPEQAVDELAAAIKANNLVEKLWLNGNHLGSSTVVVVHALKDVSTLKELNLNDNRNRSEELAPAIASMINSNTLVEKLLLSTNNLNDDGVRMISQLCKFGALKVLNLRDNNISEEVAVALASVISNNAKLEVLYLGNNQLQLGAKEIAQSLKGISSLKVLDLENNNIPAKVADELSAAIKANTSLEKLWLSGNDLGSSTVVVVNALKKIFTLKELNLNNNKSTCKILASAISSVVQKNTSMESLLLRDNGLNDDGVIKIAQSLCNHSKLRFLNLQSNSISEVAAEALASVISSNTGLEELYLGNNQLHLGATKIAMVLKDISSLKVLDLRNNKIPEQVADKLSIAIKANRFLEVLWLDGNHLASSTVVIVNALNEISTLQDLSLNDNENKSEKLAIAITSVLTKNRYMESLSLRGNNLKDNGVMKIAQSLCKQSKLNFLNLQNNSITGEAAEALASVILSNSGLKGLYLSNNQLQLGITKLATAVKNITSLEVIDLENNNLSEQVANDLAVAIAANKSLEILRLGDNYFGSSLSIIGQACYNSNLKQFSIRNTGISVALANDLAAIIRYNPSIELLSVSDNNLQSSGLVIISQAFKNMSSLKFLYANGINITSKVSSDLSSIIDHNLAMEEISLGNNSLENRLIQIAESCSKLANLKMLELSHNCIIPTNIVDLVSTVNKCNSLKSLSLAGMCMNVNENLYFNAYIGKAKSKGLTNYGNILNKFHISSELIRSKICQESLLYYDNLNRIYRYWYIYISYQHTAKFEEIIIENSSDYAVIVQEIKQKLSQVNSKAMMSSLQIIKTLKAINLENNNIEEGAATELAGHLQCNNVLEQLWLRGNELYDKGASVVLQSLHNLSTLLILDLSFNHLSSESADGIAVVISNNCLLQQLWLDGNDLLTRGVVVIASALKNLSGLRILSLCSNGITDGAAEEISDVITSNVLLVDLLLGNNQLQASGICKIAVALRKLLMLRRLDLYNNHFTPDAVEALAVTLSKCTNLQQLFLNDNMLGTEGTIKIANALQCVNSLQVLTLSNNNITESATDVLVQVLKNNTSLKILLIGGNNLQTSGIKLIAQTAKNVTTLQLLDVSDNNVSEDEKENFKAIFASNSNFIIIV